MRKDNREEDSMTQIINEEQGELTYMTIKNDETKIMEDIAQTRW